MHEKLSGSIYPHQSSKREAKQWLVKEADKLCSM